MEKQELLADSVPEIYKYNFYKVLNDIAKRLLEKELNNKMKCNENVLYTKK